MSKNSFLRLERTFYYTILLFLPTQLGKHFWPAFAFVGGLRVDYLSPTFYFTDFLLISLFCVFIIRKLFLQKTRASVPFHSRAFQVIVGLFVVIVIGVVRSLHPEAGFFGLLKVLEMAFFGLYTASFFAKNAWNKGLFYIATLFSIGIVAETGLAYLQYVLQRNAGGLWYFLGERFFTGQTPGIANASLSGELVLRPYGTFSHPNVLAGYLLLTTIFILLSVFLQKRMQFLPVFIIGVCGIFLTLSRTAIILFSASFFFLLLAVFNKRAKQYFLIAVTAITIITVFIIFPHLRERFALSVATDSSVTMRELSIKQALSLIASHPFFGVGLQNYYYYSPAWQLRANVFSYQPVHNMYLFVVSQIGLVGGAFLFIAFFLYCKNVIRPSPSRLFRITLLSVVLLFGFFDHYFFTMQQGQLLFAFVFGFAASSKR